MTSRTHPRTHQPAPTPKPEPLPNWDTLAPYDGPTDHRQAK